MTTAKHVVIIGGGTGGTTVANWLRRMLRAADADITMIDPDGDHVYQPGLLFLPSGLAEPSELVRPRATRGLGRRGGQSRVHCTWEVSNQRPWCVTSIDIEVGLPADTPPESVAAVARAVGRCTVHNSIVQAPSISVATSLGEPAQPRAA